MVFDSRLCPLHFQYPLIGYPYWRIPDIRRDKYPEFVTTNIGYSLERIMGILFWIFQIVVGGLFRLNKLTSYETLRINILRYHVAQMVFLLKML